MKPMSLEWLRALGALEPKALEAHKQIKCQSVQKFIKLVEKIAGLL